MNQNDLLKYLKNIIIPVLSISFFLTFSCEKKDSQPKELKTNTTANSFGVGPIQSKIELGPLDNALAQKGEIIFNEKCTACHKLEERYVGPPIKDVTKRRSPEWIMNMILEPIKMTQEDPIAKELLAQYLTQMTNQNISIEEARAILEYFRKIDQ